MMRNWVSPIRRASHTFGTDELQSLPAYCSIGLDQSTSSGFDDSRRSHDEVSFLNSRPSVRVRSIARELCTPQR
jgi:hypothetical protein